MVGEIATLLRVSASCVPKVLSRRRLAKVLISCGSLRIRSQSIWLRVYAPRNWREREDVAPFPDAHPKEWRMQCYSAP
jgi:hypothetical protein